MVYSPATGWLEWVGAPLLLLGPPPHKVISVNVAARHLMGALAVPRLPCALQALIGEAASDQLCALMPQAELGKPSAPLVATCQIGGRPRTMTFNLTALPEPGEHWLLTLLDRSARDEASRGLALWQHDMEAILNGLPVGVEITDAEMRTQFVNDHLSKLFGYTTDDIRTLDDWWRVAYPDPSYREMARRSWFEGVAQARATNREMHPQEWIVTCKDGRRKTIQFRYRAVGVHHISVYTDVSAERQMEAELRRLADTDPLTGLYNRRAFFQEAAAQFQTSLAKQGCLSILLLDLDHFKAINDRFGHAIGDLALQTVALRCRQALREGDVVARLGGEEFAVILPDADEARAYEVAERLRNAIGWLPVEAGLQRLELTVSIGGATRAEQEVTLESLLERADRALYVAKRDGRNCVRFGRPSELPEGPVQWID